MTPTPPDRGRARVRADDGTGVFATAFGFTVFVIFLLFAVQVIFGLYARSTVSAIAADVARRAAFEDGLAVVTDGDRWEHEVRRRLGSRAASSDVAVTTVDADGDGRADTVEVRISMVLPTLLPQPWGGDTRRIDRRARARIESTEVAA